jgi:D-psicose/D-tagatose/L-ribulose 3-epimerase
MKLGINTFIWSLEFGDEQAHLLGKLKGAGFDGIEVAVFDPATFRAQLVRESTADYDMEATVCGVIPRDLSLIAEDAGVRRATLDYLKRVIDAVADCGAKIWAGPFYSPVGYLPGRRRTADEWNYAVAGYQELGPFLAERGVTLALEPLNRFETYFLNTAADAVKLVEAVDHPNVGILFDTFHANIEEKDIAQGYRTCGRWLKHVHTCENDRGTPGSGHVEWDAVFTALEQMGYDGWLTIESFGFALPELSAAAAIWRDIEKSPEDIAWDGIEFLKSRFGPGR